MLECSNISMHFKQISTVCSKPYSHLKLFNIYNLSILNNLAASACRVVLLELLLIIIRFNNSIYECFKLIKCFKLSHNNNFKHIYLQ